MKILILLVVKTFELVPAICYGLFKPFQTVQYIQLKVRWHLSGIPEWHQLPIEDPREWLPGLLGSEAEAYHQEGRHEEACVCLLIKLRATMVKDLDALVLLIFEDAIQLETVSVQLREVEGPEILVISLVHEHGVHIEEEAVGHILRRFWVAVPVQTVYRYNGLND